MVRRVGGIEEARGVCVSVGVASAAERGQHLAELCERHGDVRADRLCDQLGLCGQALGLLRVPTHRGNQRDDRVGRGLPLRFSELVGETAGLFGCGNRHLPITEARGHARVKGQQSRQVPESSLRPESINCRREEIVAQVKGADNKRGWAEEPRSVGVDPLVRRRPAQPRQNTRCVTQRICIRVDREHPWILGICISQPT